jgi:hypothetical protein
MDIHPVNKNLVGYQAAIAGKPRSYTFDPVHQKENGPTMPR